MMNIAVAQSGGPTCAINASLVGVFKEALKFSEIDAIFGSINGIEGIIENHLVDLKTTILSNNDMELLRQTPSTVLGSCRYKLPDWHEDEATYRKIIDTLKQRNIGAFFYIGGNDSMDTVNKLSEYFGTIGLDIKVIGIPKTIDNDLCITDHTPGFGSAAKYVATTMHEITRDSIVYPLSPSWRSWDVMQAGSQRQAQSSMQWARLLPIWCTYRRWNSALNPSSRMYVSSFQSTRQLSLRYLRV